MSADLTIEQIGEFGLIDRIVALLGAVLPLDPAVELGPGDDAALWRPAPGRSVVATIDTLVEAVHFRLDLMSWADLGHRALAVNLSDLASMGARPVAALVSLGPRAGTRVEDVLDLYRGMAALARADNVSIVGGDIVASPTALTITISALGEQAAAPDGRPVALRRDAARPGDLVAVTGPLGLSAAGLALLLDDPAGAMADARNAPLLAAYRRPAPRTAAARALLAAGVRAGMDVSDGLAGDLPRLCRRSGVSAVLEIDHLPTHPRVRALHPATWRDLALRGGEDFELLVTLPPALLGRADDALAAAGQPPLLVIGALEAPGAEPLWLREASGARVALAAGAFDHFAPATRPTPGADPAPGR